MLGLYFQFFSCSVDLTLQPSSHTSKSFQNSSLCNLLCDVWDWEDVLIFVLPAHLVFFEEASDVRGSYYSCLEQLNVILWNEKILEQVPFLSGPDT